MHLCSNVARESPRPVSDIWTLAARTRWRASTACGRPTGEGTMKAVADPAQATITATIRVILRISRTATIRVILWRYPRPPRDRQAVQGQTKKLSLWPFACPKKARSNLAVLRGNRDHGSWRLGNCERAVRRSKAALRIRGARTELSQPAAAFARSRFFGSN